MVCTVLAPISGGIGVTRWYWGFDMRRNREKSFDTQRNRKKSLDMRRNREKVKSFHRNSSVEFHITRRPWALIPIFTVPRWNQVLESAPQGRRRLQSFFPKSVREDDLYNIFVFFSSVFCFFFHIFIFQIFSSLNQNLGVNKKNY